MKITKKIYCNDPDCEGQPGCSCRTRVPISPDCNSCSTEMVRVIVPSNLSHTRRNRLVEKPIDQCLVPFVKALNSAGIYTSNCCCSHGQGVGEIILHDGRRILIHAS